MYAICNNCGNSWQIEKRSVVGRECSKCRSTNLTYITNKEFMEKRNIIVSKDPDKDARIKELEEKLKRTLGSRFQKGHDPWDGRRKKKDKERQEEQRRLREVEEKTSRERRETERIKRIKTDLKKILVSEGITEMWESAKKHGMNDEEFIDYLTGSSFQKSREEAEIILSLLKGK